MGQPERLGGGALSMGVSSIPCNMQLTVLSTDSAIFSTGGAWGKGGVMHGGSRLQCPGLAKHKLTLS